MKLCELYDFTFTGNCAIIVKQNDETLVKHFTKKGASNEAQG